jgi:hypothetical protein
MNPAQILFVSLGAGVAVFLVGYLALGLHRRARLAPEAGLAALNQLKWREFAECAAALFARRGFAMENRDRKPGDGGFDLQLERDGKRFLVQLKESASYVLDDEDLEQLSQVMRTQGALGGFVVTTGHVAPAVAQSARRMRIEVLHGTALWREIAGHVPQAVTHEALASSHEAWQRRMTATGATGVVVAFALFAGLYLYPRLTAAPGAKTATPAAADAGLDEPEVGSLAPPPSIYSPAELDARRQQAADLIGNVEGVASVGWSTRSTLVVAVNGGNKAAREKIIAEVCKRLLTYDELRLTRLQVHEFEPATADDARVHLQQCR